MNVWFVPLRITSSAARAGAQLLDQQERERLQRLRGEKLQHAFIASHTALRGVLGAQLGIAPQAVQMTIDPLGKPALAPAHGTSAPHFNLSHSGDWAAIAVTRQGPVGIDIEPLADAALRTQGLGDTLGLRERRTLARCPAALHPLALLRLWVRKEALLKATGCGITRGLQQVQVSLGARARLQHCTHPRVTAGDWSLTALDRPDAWVAALAVRGPLPALTVRHWRWDTFATA